MPPGTSDIHLTLVQTLSITGALIVSTPQQLAIADVVRGLNMFKHNSINVPILGIVENMSWFTPAELPNNKYYIFGKGHIEKIAEKYHLPILGKIPLVDSVTGDCDKELPSVLNNSVLSKAFAEVTQNLINVIENKR